MSLNPPPRKRRPVPKHKISLSLPTLAIIAGFFLLSEGDLKGLFNSVCGNLIF